MTQKLKGVLEKANNNYPLNQKRKIPDLTHLDLFAWIIRKNKNK